MRALDKLRLRLRSLFRRGQVERELEAELRFHFEQLIGENMAAGMGPAEARAAALRTMGGITQFEELCRDTRRMQVVDDLGRDLRHAVRVLRRAPGFTVIAVLTLALGIGATTAIFSVVYGVLLKALPFHEPERLVGVWHQRANQGPGTFFTYRDNQQAFEDIGAWETNQVTVTGRGEPERVEALSVTDATLPLLRVKPALGRLFDRGDDLPGSPPRVVLSHGYWQRKLGRAPDVVGQRLLINGRSTEVIGVLPASFRFLRSKPAVLLPMRLDRANIPQFILDFQAVARLKPGVTLAQANADLGRMIALLPPAYVRLRLQPDVHPLAQDVIGDVGRMLWILLGTVAIVLLIACANVANLFLVRAEGRHQEIAVRAALGASRGRITRELLAESLALGLAGGVVGMAFASAGLGLLRRLAPAALPRLDEIGIDPVVVLFTLGISLLTGLLFGVIPAVRLGAPGAAALKEGGRAASEAPIRQRTRNALVVAEVAMALVLLIGSGLMIRTFVAMWRVEPGFTRPDEVQTFRISLPPGMVPEMEQVMRTHERIAARVRQVPGVVSVSFGSAITMDGEDNMNPIFVEHAHAPYEKLPPFRRMRSIAPGYFATLGNRLLAGRDFTWADVYQREPVILISEALAREHWGTPAEALGKRLGGSPRSWKQVVGVVAGERDDGLTRPPTPIVYWPLLNSGGYQPRTMSYAVRSPRVSTPGFLAELRLAVWSVNAGVPLAEVRTLHQIQADSMAQTSFAMVMLAIAASVALLLGLVGIYGVIAYVATLRRREIGIRMALGAQTGDVRRLFLRQGLLLTAIGIAVGTVASVALTRAMSALLFGVGPMDPLTYAAVAAGLGAVALVATWLPARRASRVDPMIALRAES